MKLLYFCFRLSQFILIFPVLFLAISCAGGALNKIQNRSPSPELDFEEVVNIQLTALANDNEEHEGIAVAYKFAAPSNKKLVGPLERFIVLFENPLYAPMLDPLETEFLSSVQREDMAYQVVRIRSRASVDFYYIFVLERQKSGELAGCWMTAAVRTYISTEQLRRDMGLLAPGTKI